MEIKENSNLSEMIGNSLKSLKELSDSETIVGSPIVTASGVTVIPVSKLSMGFVGGGLDYGKKIKSKPDVKEYSEGKPNFGGGGGTGISLVPVAFLVVSPEGNVSVLPITNEAQNDRRRSGRRMTNAPDGENKRENPLKEVVSVAFQNASYLISRPLARPALFFDCRPGKRGSGGLRFGGNPLSPGVGVGPLRKERRPTPTDRQHDEDRDRPDRSAP